MKLDKSFDVRCSRAAAVAALASEDALLGLFPDAKCEIVARDAGCTTVRTHYRALGQEGTATFRFFFEPSGEIRFEKVCDGRVWRQLAGAVSFTGPGARTKVRVEMEGRTKPFVPELAIRGPMRDQLDKMASAVRERLEDL